MDNTKELNLFAMSNSQILGKKVAQILNIPLSPIKKTVFNDGEILVTSNASVRNRDAFVICSAAKPINDSIMEVLIFIDALKRASAKSINIIMTYYGYSRQDRKNKGREPISAKLVADLLETAGISKLVAVDLHNPSIQGFFNVPVDDLKAQYILADYFDVEDDYKIVSPDHGGAPRARVLSNILFDNSKGRLQSKDKEIAIIDKRRVGPNKAIMFGILGSVQDRNCLIIDDIIDTGGTILKAANLLKEKGAKKIMVVASHGLFSGGFEQFDQNENVSEVLITDSIPSVYNIKSKKLKVVSLASFLAGVIQATHNGGAITNLYTKLEEDLKSR